MIRAGMRSLTPRSPRNPLAARGRLAGWIIRVAAGFAVAAAPAWAQTGTPADSTGTLVGIVLMKDGGLPLAYSVVSAAAFGRERFSNAEGVFTLTELPAGSVQLRVRHLGYLPSDLSAIVHAGRVDTIRVSLTHVAVRLSAVEVHALPECKNPGVPKAASDSAFATVFDQLRQNAEQYRLLTDAYPFQFAFQRTMWQTLVNGDVHVESEDTLVLASNKNWTYRPGTVVSRPARSVGSLTVNIPTLIHFADDVFLDNHCFYNGGVETVDGTELLRIDFNAAARIKDPDFDGEMYLDPVTFQIRRSVLRLSKIPNGLRGLLETEAETQFGEVLPSIPVITEIGSVNRFQADQSQPKSPAAASERQRLIAVHFLKGKPGEEPKKP